MKRERNRSRTIVTVIAKRSVTAAPNIWAIMNCVHRPDRVFDCVGRVRWRVCDSVSQHRAISWHHRMRTADIETGRSRFGIVFVAIVRLSGTNRSRRIIRDLNRLRLLRFPLERKRLKRDAGVGRLRWINRFARSRLSMRGRCDKNQKSNRYESDRVAADYAAGLCHACPGKLLLGQIISPRAPLDLPARRIQERRRELPRDRPARRDCVRARISSV